MRPIRVVCVEDNRLVADAIERMLQRAGGFEWLGWVGSTGEMIERVERDAPDVVCMDIDLPGDDAFSAARLIHDRFPTSRVLMLTGHLRDDYIDRALDAGAWGYVSKGEEPEFIVGAVRRIAAGEFVFGPLTQLAFLYAPGQRQDRGAPARAE